MKKLISTRWQTTVIKVVQNWLARSSPLHRMILLGVGLVLGGAVIIFMVDTPPAGETITRPAKTKPPAEQTPTEEALTYQEMFQEIASQHNLDWRILEALAYRESHMDYLAVGPSNDMGLMQITPPTWDEWAPKVGVEDPFDPYSNIQVGAAYLAFVRNLCAKRGHSEPHCMLVAYHWGPSRLDRLFKKGGTWDEVPASQRQYAQQIINIAKKRKRNPAFLEKFYADLAAEQ